MSNEGNFEKIVIRRPV